MESQINGPRPRGPEARRLSHFAYPVASFTLLAPEYIGNLNMQRNAYQGLFAVSC